MSRYIPTFDLAKADHRRGRSGFSLLELMIAIVILGLGLIMVATMYPVAWSRARDLSEFTRHKSITEAAHTTVKTLTRANDGSSAPLPLPGSFAGDWIYDPSLPITEIAKPNTRVHPLYLENVTAAAPRRFVPNRFEPWRDPLQTEPEYPPWSLAWVAVNPTLSIALDSLCDESYFEHRCDNLFLSSQIQLESRVYPPIRPRDDASLDLGGEGIFSDTIDDLAWDEALDTTRFAWAAFHRLVEPVFILPSSDWIDERLYERDRVFEMYYVSLRRPQPTLRYARQDPDPVVTPDPGQREIVVTPAALDADLDVLLPEPWRVQVYFPVAQIELAVDSTGIPTEIEVNTTNAPTAVFVVDMFQVGTQFIDEQNGAIYRVIKRRVTGTDLDQAYLTLDREVVIEDLDDGPGLDGGDGLLDDWVDKVETLRTVWVFPPPVEAARAAEGAPVFVGKQPVIDIETRKLKLPAG